MKEDQSAMRLLSVAALLACAALPALADVSTNALVAPKGKYTSDPNHTLVTWCVSHMGLSSYCGRFNKIEAKLVFNGAQPEKSKVSVTIDLASVDSQRDALDDKLRDELFDVASNPTATFVSTETAVTAKNQGTIAGDLTIGGVTKRVVLKTSFNGGQPDVFSNAYRIGFSAEAKFDRTEFGLTRMAGVEFAGKEITLYVEAEFLEDK